MHPRFNLQGHRHARRSRGRPGVISSSAAPLASRPTQVAPSMTILLNRFGHAGVSDVRVSAITYMTTPLHDHSSRKVHLPSESATLFVVN